MAEEIKGFIVKTKDVIQLLVGLALIIGIIAKFALMQDQVQRNTKQLDKYSLEIISYRLDDMDEKLDDILKLLE